MSQEPGSMAGDSCRYPRSTAQQTLLCCITGRFIKAAQAFKDMHSTEVLENQENLTAFPGLKGFPPFAAAPSLHWPPRTVLRSHAGRSSIHILSLSAACLSQRHQCRYSQRCPGWPYSRTHRVSQVSDQSWPSQHLTPSPPISSSNQRLNVHTGTFLLKIPRPCPKFKIWPFMRTLLC